MVFVLRKDEVEERRELYMQLLSFVCVPRNENDGGMEAGETCVGHKGLIALGIYKKACEADHLDPLYFMKLKQRKMQVSEMTKDCRNVNKWR
jgi:hypothetical protein